MAKSDSPPPGKGRGRGRPPKGKDARNVVLRIRLTEAEADAFDAAARMGGHTKTVDWVRATLRSAAKMPPRS